MVGESVDSERVAAYIRWSTDEQGEGTTLLVQREACEHYIRSQGWRWRPELVFIDDGYSGGSLERPGLCALRTAVQRGEVCCCVVYKLDRLSRSVLDVVTLVLKDWDGVCHVKSTREPIDTTSPAGKMFFYTLASFAEWERSVIRERTLAGKVRRAQQGKNPGFTYPYGYRPGAHTGEWAVAPTEAPVVRRIFAAFCQGHSPTSIAAILNRDGIRSRRGGPFSPSRVARILANPCYTGVLLYGRSTVVPAAQRQRTGRARLYFHAPRYVQAPGALPAIVTPEEFAVAQGLRAARSAVRGRRSLGPQFLLSGLARCRCSAPLRGQTDSRKGRRYYRCAGACASALIPADLLEESVARQVQLTLVPGLAEYVDSSLLRALAQRKAESEAQLQVVHAAVAALTRRRRRLDLDYDAGALPAGLYTARVAEAEAELQRLHTAAATWVAELTSTTGPLVPSGGDEPAAWPQLDWEERKQVLRCVIASCSAFRPPNAGAVQVDLCLRMPTGSH